MRRILYYSLLCLLWVSVNSCKDDEASSPPPPSFTVDKTSGLLSETEFKFEVEQVGAGAVSLLPYGTENPSFGGVLIPASAFDGGKATVTFKFEHVGTFQAVAVSNNHTGGGESVKNATSAATQIVITSNKASMSDFSFDGSTKTEVDDDVDPIKVEITLPWSKHDKITELKLRYNKAAESKVTVNGVEQSSDETPNDFSGEQVVTYTVTSQDGNETQDYEIVVHQTAADPNTNFKSLSAIIANKGKLGAALKVATGRVLPSYINNVDHQIVIYDTLNSDPSVYDSLALDYAVDGSFAYAKYGEANWGKHKIDQKLAGKDTVDLTGSPTETLEIVVTPEDSLVTLRETFNVFVAEAPRLHVATTNLTPNRSGSSNENFAVNMDVINGTNTESIDAEFTFDLPANTDITKVAYTYKDSNDDDVEVVATEFDPDMFSISDINLKGGITLKVTVETDGFPVFVVSYPISLTVK